jgi:hypothetical protein
LLRQKSIKSKTIIMLMVAFLLLLTLAACGSGAEGPAEDSGTAEETAEETAKEPSEESDAEPAAETAEEAAEEPAEEPAAVTAEELAEEPAKEPAEEPAEGPGGDWKELGSNSASGSGISNNSGSSTLPSLAEAPDGSIYVAWGDTSDGNEEIYVKRWNGSGWMETGSNSAAGEGISENSGESRRPFVAVTQDGTVFVVYDDNTNGDYEIYVKRWNGSSWIEAGEGSASGGGISNNDGDSISPKIRVAPDGNPVICWIDQSSGNWEIYVKRWTGSGWVEIGSSSASGGGISNNSGSSRSCSLDFAADGTLFLGWRDDTSGDYEIYIKRWNGSSWQDVGNSSSSGGGISDNSGLSGNLSLVVGHDGNPYVFWQDDTPGNFEIYMKYWNGSSWEALGGSAPGGGISNSSGRSAGSSPLILPDGRPAIAYHDNSTGDYEIYIRYWDGSSWQPLGNSGDKGGLSNNPGDSSKPSLIISGGNKPTIAWYDNTVGNNEIYVKRME